METNETNLNKYFTSSTERMQVRGKTERENFHYGGRSPIKYLLELKNYELTEGNLKELNIHFQNGRNF